MMLSPCAPADVQKTTFSDDRQHPASSSEQEELSSDRACPEATGEVLDELTLALVAYTLQAKPSVILLRGEPLIPKIRDKILLSAILQCRRELEASAILTIDWSDRIRAGLFPIRV